MDPIFRTSASPVTHSPSLPSDLHDPYKSGHSQENSDVKNKVAQFNCLTKEAAQRRKDNEAAMRRAILGREEAESEAKRARDENRTLRIDLEEGKAREKKVAQRLESVMEELHRNKETQAHAQRVYEKEVRRARKEAFKSSSTLVKLQEELKTTRNRATLMREEVEAQKRRMESKDQEAFAAQYQLICLQEQLESTRQRIQITEEERDVMKTSLHQEEVARITAEGKTALPPSQEADEFASPKRRRESLKEVVDPEAMDIESPSDLYTLRQQMRWEKELRTHAESLIEFMKMECQFRCCSCRLAEAEGTQYMNDGGFFDPASKREPSINAKYIAAASSIFAPPSEPTEPESSSPPKAASPLGQTTEMLLNFSPSTGTYLKCPRPANHDFPHLPHLRSQTFGPSNTANEGFDEYPFPIVPQDQVSNSVEPPEQQIYFDLTPRTPRAPPDPPPLAQQAPNTAQPSIRCVAQPDLHAITILGSTTTTTTVPLAPIPVSPDRTISRDEALEQIRQRRGRAKSAAGNGTPRKPMIGPGAERRDLSAPAK
ncbi:MAG: hypothetical protein Q9208_002498 [Pyrenodesmia sp. 3 TL-2023]